VSDSFRPCLVNGTPARFHRWVESITCAVGDGSELYRPTHGLVEFDDGTIDNTVSPYLIKFTDREHKEGAAQ
jgi:hypothetical protein